MRKHWQAPSWFCLLAAVTLALCGDLPAAVTIGTENELLIDGEKFFPLFVWDQPSNQFDYLQSLGVNSMMGYDGSDGDVANWLDAGQAHGFWMIPHSNHITSGNWTHPALLAVHIDHEPEFEDSSNPGHPKEYPSEIQAREDAFKSQFPGIPTIHLMSVRFYDGYRSMCAWMNGDYSWYNLYAALGDINSYDHYPITGWNKPERIYELGAATYDLYQNYLSGTKPVWPIIEASDQDLSWTAPDTRGPLDYELRAEAWLAIVNGAKAIGYFTIAFNPFSYNRLIPEVEEEMVRTNAQITALKDAILGETPAGVSVNVTTTNGLTVQTLIKRHNDKVYLFAAEGDADYDPDDRQTGTATFTLSGTSLAAGVEVYDETRTLLPVGNTFTDSFQELDVHIYVIAATPASVPDYWHKY